MKSWIYFIIAFTFLCLSSKAQFKLVTRGQVSSYDSAVLVEINQYRSLRFKLTTAETYISSLNNEIDTLRQQVSAYRTLSQSLTTLTAKQNEFAIDNQKSFSSLNIKFDQLLTQATKPKKWYERTGVLLTAGALCAYALTR